MFVLHRNGKAPKGAGNIFLRLDRLVKRCGKHHRYLRAYRELGDEGAAAYQDSLGMIESIKNVFEQK